MRAKVEHVFRVMKCQFGYRKVRYRGIAKNAAQVFSLLALANLYLARRIVASAGHNQRPKSALPHRRRGNFAEEHRSEADNGRTVALIRGSLSCEVFGPLYI